MWAELRRPEARDPRGYIIPSDQPDFPTATKFVNALIKNGVIVNADATTPADVLVDGESIAKGQVADGPVLWSRHLEDADRRP